MPITTSPIPPSANQTLATVRSLSAKLGALDNETEELHTQRGLLLLQANRAGATYRAMSAETGLNESTIAAEIKRARDLTGAASLPKGRRKGISPKSWREVEARTAVA